MEINSVWFDQLQKKRRVLAEQLKDPAAVGLWKSVIDKYSDNAHFVYELLQNSDDAEATEVRVYISSNQIEYVHNGRISFSLTDPKLEGKEESASLGHINSITSIGSSTKQGGNKIGKFGVGFKSVFKYTDKPHIEDDSFSFDLVDYIVPVKSNRISSHRLKGETSFTFPILNFIHNIPVIKDRFQTLHNPLLFLDHLSKITVFEDENLLFSFQKNHLNEWSSGSVKCQFVQLASPSETSYFYLFSTLVNDSRFFLSCALFAHEDGRLDTSAHDEPLYCFFPTKETLGLNYIVHAPFMLTDSRENVKMNQPWNDKLLYGTGYLLLKAIYALTQRRTTSNEYVIDDSVFLLFPINALVEKHNIPHLNIHAAAYMDHLAEMRIFLSSDHTYVDGVHTLYSVDKDLPNLFLETELYQIIPNIIASKWSFLHLVENERINKSDIVKFLDMTRSIRCHVDVLTILKKISSSLLQGKTLDWLKDFYSYLSTKKTLWKENLSVLKTLPLFFCEDGVCRAAYNSVNDLQPSIYLTSGTEHHFVAVHPTLLKYPKCKAFFEYVGLQEPGVVAEIVENILPLYSAKMISTQEVKQIARHLTMFSDYYNSLPFLSEERKAFIQSVKDVPFLLVKDNEGNSSLQPVEGCFLNNSLLTSFLKDVKDAYFFENEFVMNEIMPEKRDALYAFLSAAGLHFGLTVKPVRREPSLWISEQLNLRPISLRQIDNGAQVIIDKAFVGMNELLNKATKERSAAFFKLLGIEVKNQTSFLFRKSLEGEYRYFEKAKRNPTEEIIRQTTAMNTLFHGKWLYSASGDLISVSEITETNQLAPIYDLSYSDLLIFFNIKRSDDLKSLTQDQREAVEFVSRYQSKGISIHQMETIIDQYLASHSSDETK